jgi:transcriptional regulator with XRE-family HTH domain
MNNFSDILITLRKSKNLTQTQVATAVDIVLRTYQRYENGERIPDIATAVKLADFFKVSLDYLCGRSNKK